MDEIPLGKEPLAPPPLPGTVPWLRNDMGLPMRMIANGDGGMSAVIDESVKLIPLAWDADLGDHRPWRPGDPVPLAWSVERFVA